MAGDLKDVILNEIVGLLEQLIDRVSELFLRLDVRLVLAHLEHVLVACDLGIGAEELLEFLVHVEYFFFLGVFGGEVWGLNHEHGLLLLFEDLKHHALLLAHRF